MMSKQLIENNHNRDIRLLAKKMLDDLVDIRHLTGKLHPTQRIGN
jgi:hypothetical protein